MEGPAFPVAAGFWSPGQITSRKIALRTCSRIRSVQHHQSVLIIEDFSEFGKAGLVRRGELWRGISHARLTGRQSRHDP